MMTHKAWPPAPQDITVNYSYKKDSHLRISTAHLFIYFSFHLL